MTNIAPQSNGNNNPPFNPNEYQAGSAAVSFAALLEVLKAYQDMRNSTAKTSTEVTQAKANAVETQANSTYDSYKADADILGFQASEAWGQVAASAVQLGSSAYAGYACHESAENLTNADNLVGAVKTHISASEFGRTEVAPPPRTEAETALLERHKREIIDGFNPAGYKKGLDSKLDRNGTLTLKDVFETAGENDRRDLVRALTKAQKLAHTDYQAAQTKAQTITGTFNAIGQGAASANSAIFKQTSEAQATLEKAQAAKDQAYAEASKVFAEKVYESMQGLIDQGNQGVEKIYQYMAQMVAQDSRA